VLASAVRSLQHRTPRGHTQHGVERPLRPDVVIIKHLRPESIRGSRDRGDAQLFVVALFQLGQPIYTVDIMGANKIEIETSIFTSKIDRKSIVHSVVLIAPTLLFLEICLLPTSKVNILVYRTYNYRPLRPITAIDTGRRSACAPSHRARTGEIISDNYRQLTVVGCVDDPAGRAGF